MLFRSRADVAETANYEAGGSQPVNFVILKAALTVTADAKSKTEGEADDAIKAKKPQVILCPPELVDSFKERFAGIRVEGFDVSLLESHGGKIADAVEQMNALFYSLKGEIRPVYAAFFALENFFKKIEKKTCIF